MNEERSTSAHFITPTVVPTKMHHFINVQKMKVFTSDSPAYEIQRASFRTVRKKNIYHVDMCSGKITGFKADSNGNISKTNETINVE